MAATVLTDQGAYIFILKERGILFLLHICASLIKCVGCVCI